MPTPSHSCLEFPTRKSKHVKSTSAPNTSTPETFIENCHWGNFHWVNHLPRDSLQNSILSQPLGVMWGTAKLSSAVPNSKAPTPRFAKILCSLDQCVSIPGLQWTGIAPANSSTQRYYWKDVGALKQPLEETGWKIKGPGVALWSWDTEMQMCFLAGTFWLQAPVEINKCQPCWGSLSFGV